MNEYVENAKKMLETATQKVVEKSSTIYSSTKLSLKITKLKAEIDKCYKKIGEIVYTNYKGGEASKDDVEILCGKIQSLNEEIDDISEKVAEIKGLDVCQVCGAEVKKGSTYCAKCGTEI